MATVSQVDVHLFDQYVNSARALLGELSKIVGDSYDPGEDYELTNTIHRVMAVSTSVLTVMQSLHAFHPPMVTNVPGTPPTPPPNFPELPNP